ncbi:Versatile peroxidase VPL1 like protein [Verticillium longisporum]|nr:Versatile peroxidase VPL1 like protein [Verticillium longisporum]
MKFSIVLVALTAGTSIAHPGMSKAMADIQEIQARDGRSGPSTEMIGDLVDLDDRRLTATGRDIKNILSGRGIPQNTVASYWLGAPRLGGLLCRMDQRCVWKHIANEMRGMMVGDAGRCNNLARTSIRLGFHDAATWSKDTGGTGADGSIVLTAECARVPENNGLAEFAANVATVSCPLGPRIKTYIGRKDNAVEPPRNLLPSPFHSADRLLELFADKTFTADGLIALMGAHSRASSVSSTIPAPGAWNHAYAAEYVRMSLLGVYNINSLTDCTKALPPFQRSYSSSDKSVIDRFMHGLIGSAQKVKNLLLKGDKVPSNV